MINQLKVKLDNKPGALKGCVGLLAEQGVDLKALELTERGSGEYGEAHLIVSDLQKATATLDRAGYKYEVETVLAVEMDDRIGGLAAVLDLLVAKEINIRYLYAFVTRIQGKSLAVFNVERPEEAARVLEEAKLPLVSQTKIEQSKATGPVQTASLEDHFGGDFIW